MTFAEKLWKEWFKDGVVVGCDPYFIKKDEFIAELTKIISDTEKSIEQQIEKDILELIGKDIDYSVHNPSIKAHKVKPDTEGYADYSSLPDSWYECTTCGTHIRKHGWVNEAKREEILLINQLKSELRLRLKDYLAIEK